MVPDSHIQGPSEALPMETMKQEKPEMWSEKSED